MNEEGWLIGELSDRVGVSAHINCCYERLGLLEPPKRTELNLFIAVLLTK